jgi:hypothetical protein
MNAQKFIQQQRNHSTHRWTCFQPSERIIETVGVNTTLEDGHEARLMERVNVNE